MYWRTTLLFNDRKEQALEEYENKIDSLKRCYDQACTAASSLNEIREESKELISTIEDYINKMTRTPKSICETIDKIEIELLEYKKTEEYAKESYDTAVKSGVIMSSGILVGMGISLTTPSQWKCLTTTFGKDKAKKAVETLPELVNSTTDTKLLNRIKQLLLKADTSPSKQSIIITAIAIILGATYQSYSNYEIATQIEEDNFKINRECIRLLYKEIDIKKLTEETRLLKNDLKNQLPRLVMISQNRPDYYSLSNASRQFLRTYITNTYTFATLLNKEIL